METCYCVHVIQTLHTLAHSTLVKGKEVFSTYMYIQLYIQHTQVWKPKESGSDLATTAELLNV